MPEYPKIPNPEKRISKIHPNMAIHLKFLDPVGNYDSTDQLENNSSPKGPKATDLYYWNS